MRSTFQVLIRYSIGELPQSMRDCEGVVTCAKARQRFTVELTSQCGVTLECRNNATPAEVPALLVPLANGFRNQNSFIVVLCCKFNLSRVPRQHTGGPKRLSTLEAGILCTGQRQHGLKRARDEPTRGDAAQTASMLWRFGETSVADRLELVGDALTHVV